MTGHRNIAHMPDDITAALDVFSVLGEMPNDFESAKFKFYIVAGWQSPSFSPIVLLPGESLERADLDKIEEFFRGHPIRNPTLNQAPYFNFFASQGLYDTEAIQKVCSEAGWVIDPDPLSIDFLHVPMPVSIPAGMYVTIVDVGKSGLHPEYKDIIQHNFNADDEYLEAVDRVYRRSDADSYTVLIGFLGGASIAGGTISIRNGLGFLTWGSVNTEYRNKGFHRLLISACTMVAMSYGVRRCALTTRNKVIRGKWNSLVEMFICRKAR